VKLLYDYRRRHGRNMNSFAMGLKTLTDNYLRLCPTDIDAAIPLAPCRGGVFRFFFHVCLVLCLVAGARTGFLMSGLQ
jgi:hypothetical protein